MELQKQWSRLRCDILLELEDNKKNINTNTTDSNSSINAKDKESTNLNNVDANSILKPETKSNANTNTNTNSNTNTNTITNTNTKTNTSKSKSNIKDKEKTTSTGITDTISSFFLGNKEKKSANSVDKDDHSLGLFKVKNENVEWCNDNKAKYDVIPLRSWGRLPMNMIDEWKKRTCDKVFTNMRMSKKKIVVCDAKPKGSSKFPVIAVMAASTTRKVISPSGKYKLNINIIIIIIIIISFIS